MRRILAAELALCVMLVCVLEASVAQDEGRPASRPQVMLSIRVLKVVLAKKHSAGLEWGEMPFKPGPNKKIDFYKVLDRLKSAGDLDVLFNESLIGIAGRRIKADTTVTVPARGDGKGSIEVGGRFAGELDVEGDNARVALEYTISYIYGPPPYSVAKTSFKGDVAIKNGQTLVLDDLIVEEGAEKRFAEVLVFISAFIVR